MTDFEKELLEQVRELRIALGSLIGQVNKNEGTLQALALQVAQIDAKVDALPQATKAEKSIVRDSGLTLSGGAVAAIVGVIIQHWTK